MEITEVNIRKITGEYKVKAYVSITFDNIFAVHNIKVINGQNGLYLAMPGRKTAIGEYKDVAHPIKPGFRAEMQKKMLEKYEYEINNGIINDNSIL
jgi:stage V sporulation protein G